MDRIGSERQGLVREIFRNLVTAQGTRAVIDREELLSAFPDRAGAEEALRQLVDARLLTTSEVEGKEDEPSHHRIEVVHESLLKAWPRLVHWQAQDEEGALLRDQLKQAAHLWDEKSRTPDLLWSGTAFREFELWRERYPGKLTALEEDFSHSMVERARRQKRLRRIATASVVAAAVVVAVATGALWWRAERAREQTRREALRAEAAGLFSLAQHRLDEHPTEALAYAMASLERADDLPVRHLALEALWRGPTELRLPTGQGLLEFSPDGRWLAAGRPDDGWALWTFGRRTSHAPGGQQRTSRRRHLLGSLQRERRSDPRSHGRGTTDPGSLVGPGRPSCPLLPNRRRDGLLRIFPRREARPDGGGTTQGRTGRAGVAYVAR